MAGTPLTDAINALTTYSNTVTGASDTTLSEAVATLASGYGGGGSSQEDAILERTITTLTNGNITKLGQYALGSATALTSISLPNVTELKGHAFDGCTSLTQITDTELPSLADDIGDYAFGYMTGLQTVNLTNAITVGNHSYIFRNCTSLTSFYMPKLSTSANLTRWFYDCTNLAVADLGNCAGIGTGCFQGNTALRTLVLRKTSVAALGGWTAAILGGVYNNPSASTIYVPQALISSYQTASNWSSAYSAGVTFAKIEGSIYEL